MAASASSFETKTSALGPALCWLHDHGVAAADIACIFSLQDNHVRLLVHRSRTRQHSFPHPANTISDLLDRPAQLWKANASIRAGADIGLLSGKGRKRLADLSDALEVEISSSRSRTNLQEGLNNLATIRPLIGYPSNTERIRLLGRFHQQRAWIYTHMGLSTSAFEEARASINLYQTAHREKENKEDLKRISQSCLIASNACLLSQDPAASMKLLNLADEASLVFSDKDLADHHRQRGVALFQLSSGNDAIAKKYFLAAAEALSESHEPQTKASVAIAGDRHISMLGKQDWNLASHVYELSLKTYTQDSLQVCMTAVSLAACGLGIDSPSLHEQSMRILMATSASAQTFGHQKTKLMLLSKTLELPKKLRQSWVRWSLYANFFRDK